MSRALARTCTVALVGAAVALALSTAAVPAVASAQGTETKMSIKGFAYSMPVLKVKVGDTVTWTNEDKAPHDVVTTKAPVKIKSPIMNTGQSFSYTFTKAGAYDYICSIHPQMTARVDAAAAEPAAAEPAAKPAAAKTTATTATATKAAAAKPAAAKAAKPRSGEARQAVRARR